ncbi:MAG: hypothetical protein HUJ66_00020 [Oscillospiraceae bacterium]|nr:hypothetical protein [Oscillospiraceae bacterium]
MSDIYVINALENFICEELERCFVLSRIAIINHAFRENLKFTPEEMDEAFARLVDEGRIVKYKKGYARAGLSREQMKYFYEMTD